MKVLKFIWKKIIVSFFKWLREYILNRILTVLIVGISGIIEIINIIFKNTILYFICGLGILLSPNVSQANYFFNLIDSYADENKQKERRLKRQVRKNEKLIRRSHELINQTSSLDEKRS